LGAGGALGTDVAPGNSPPSVVLAGHPWFARGVGRFPIRFCQADDPAAVPEVSRRLFGKTCRRASGIACCSGGNDGLWRSAIDPGVTNH